MEFTLEPVENTMLEGSYFSRWFTTDVEVKKQDGKPIVTDEDNIFLVRLGQMSVGEMKQLFDYGDIDLNRAKERFTLLALAIDPTTSDKELYTELVARNFSQEIVTIIVQLGKSVADICFCEDELLPLDKWSESRINAISQDPIALFLTCKYNMPDVATAVILRNKSNPKYAGDEGTTALMYACVNGMADVALKLIGISQVDHVNNYGNTALIFACSYGDPDHPMSKVALALIETGNHNPNQINRHGTTAFMTACSEGNDKVAFALMTTSNIKFDQPDKDGNTALIFACSHGGPNDPMDKVALALIETGKCNPGHIDMSGNTALLEACNRRKSKVAIALIATNESKPEIKSYHGIDALSHAKWHRMTAVVNALKKVMKKPKNPRVPTKKTNN